MSNTAEVINFPIKTERSGGQMADLAIRHGRLGLFRDHRAVIDFDMKRFGLVPKAAVGMNYSLLGSPVFQRVLDVREAIHG